MAKNYLLLIHDLVVSKSPVEYNSRKHDSMVRISEYLKGTLLQEVPISPASARLTCLVLDTEEVIECDENDVDPLTPIIKDLLLAISSCKERFEVFRNKERLKDGLDMQPGSDVVVRLPAMSGEVYGKLRYKGPIYNKVGIHFGVELINARGKGNSNGTLNSHKYFECSEDCGIFLALNRVTSKDYSQLQTPVPAPRRGLSKSTRQKNFNSSSSSYRSGSLFSRSSQSSTTESVMNVREEELKNLNINIGMEVYIFTEVSGTESQERGTVKFIGRLPGELPTDDIYVGIELVNPSGNGRGVFNKKSLFKTKLNHAALVPLSGVLPASTFDATIPSTAEQGLQHTSSYRQMADFREPLHAYDRTPDYLTTVKKPASSSHSSHTLPADSARRYRSHNGVSTFAEYDGETASHDIDIYSGEARTDQSNIFTPSSSHYPDTYLRSNHRPVNNRNALENSQNFPLPDMFDLEVNTMVEVHGGYNSDYVKFAGSVYGVIRWIGDLPGYDTLMAGVELEVERDDINCTNGYLNGFKYFDCSGKALFVPLRNCHKDPRFMVTDHTEYRPPPVIQQKTHKFGDFEAPQIPGSVPPPSKLDNKMLGKGRGIQGHHNSCYLDSTLFSMFAYSYCLDSILLREKNDDDLPQYQQVQKVLREDIVNPLRRRNFVRADRIMRFRELLDGLTSVTGLTNEEKDPEEFLQTLLIHVFKAEPLFELRQGDSDNTQECFFYQIFLDKDENMVLPSTQLLIEQSFLASDLKFREVPVCLILQMPRFGKDYRMYNRVRPSLTLDITDMVERFPRSCTVCGRLAEYECKQCSIERSMQEHISSYCEHCVTICHQHPLRRQHKYKKAEVSDEYRSFAAQEGEAPAERQILDLYAVVCIETSHYVSFAKCGQGRNAKWCFFDSMADRVGEQSGYNIPQVTYCEDFEKWLGLDNSKLLEMDQRDMPEHMRRLLCDAYMCLYQSREMMCYR